MQGQDARQLGYILDSISLFFCCFFSMKLLKYFIDLSFSIAWILLVLLNSFLVLEFMGASIFNSLCVRVKGHIM